MSEPVVGGWMGGLRGGAGEHHHLRGSRARGRGSEGERAEFEEVAAVHGLLSVFDGGWVPESAAHRAHRLMAAEGFQTRGDGGSDNRFVAGNGCVQLLDGGIVYKDKQILTRTKHAAADARETRGRSINSGMLRRREGSLR